MHCYSTIVILLAAPTSYCQLNLPRLPASIVALSLCRPTLLATQFAIREPFDISSLFLSDLNLPLHKHHNKQLGSSILKYHHFIEHYLYIAITLLANRQLPTSSRPPTSNRQFHFPQFNILLSSQCQTQRTSNLKSQAPSKDLGFTHSSLLLRECLASTALPILAGAAVSRPKLEGPLVYGLLGRPPGPYPHLHTVKFSADVWAAMESSRWATKEGQSSSTMGQLLLLAIFTRAKAVAMAELQVLLWLIFYAIHL